jgi:hypothetical protein
MTKRSRRTGLGALVLLAAGCAEAAGLDEDGTGGEGATGPNVTTASGSSSSSSSTATTTTTAGASTASAATSSSTATTAASTTTGGQTCDGTLDCAACQTCAVGGPCATQYAACINDPQCTALNDCLNACTPGDQPCLDGCSASYPQGAGLLQAAASCVFCVACYSDCDGASIGCP